LIILLCRIVSVNPHLRASNDHKHCLLPLSLSKGKWPRLPFTARIERARFYCALCEQEGHLATPISPSLRNMIR